MNKNVTVVVGGQFGSEAKGKVVAYLAGGFEMAVRTGSPNAGHTVISGNKTYRLQQIPATFLNPKCQLYIGAGALINPEILKREVEETSVKDRLFIDYQAGIIEPEHLEQEGELVKQIGSTGKGCGAALINRIWRKNFKLAKDILVNEFNLIDVSRVVNQHIDAGKNILLEGTQGFGLSLYHGSYPYVTSRDTTAANFLAEAGISPLAVKDIILVLRTYPIRVAGPSGPLANEISWVELSQKIGQPVEELSTVTRKVRRVAEFDLELVKRAIQANRPTQIALQFLNYLFPKDENVTTWEDLSPEAKNYLEQLEQTLQVPITLIGTGRAHEAMIDQRQSVF